MNFPPSLVGNAKRILVSQRALTSPSKTLGHFAYIVFCDNAQRVEYSRGIVAQGGSVRAQNRVRKKKISVSKSMMQ